MKICLIGPTHPFRGGISHYTTLLFKHLKKRHDVRFFAFKRQYPRCLFPGKTDIDPSKSRFAETGVEHLLDSLSPVTWLRVVQRIVRFQPDVVIIPWWVSFWTLQFITISLLSRQLCKTKILFLCHNVVEHESGWIDRLLTSLVLKTGDLYIVHSGEDERNLLNIIPHARVRRHFHPTYDIFAQDQFDGEQIKSRLGIEGRTLLFFGFVREYKGLKYLIQALPYVLEKISVTLLVVGEFWKDKADYLRLIADLNLEDHVVIVDEYVPNEEVGSYFDAADFVCQPYTSATGSGIVQIAFGFDKPVIATAVGSLPEIVKDDFSGLIVPPESPRQLADAILKAYQNDRYRLMARNVHRERYRFSWDSMVDTIEGLAKG